MILSSQTANQNLQLQQVLLYFFLQLCPPLANLQFSEIHYILLIFLCWLCLISHCPPPIFGLWPLLIIYILCFWNCMTTSISWSNMLMVLIPMLLRQHRIILIIAIKGWIEKLSEMMLQMKEQFDKVNERLTRNKLVWQVFYHTGESIYFNCSSSLFLRFVTNNNHRHDCWIILVTKKWLIVW